jgi:hypothetical protein
LPVPGVDLPTPDASCSPAGHTCADCTTRLGWQQEGDRLTVDEVSGRGTTPLDRLVWQGDWTGGNGG